MKTFQMTHGKIHRESVELGMNSWRARNCLPSFPFSAKNVKRRNGSFRKTVFAMRSLIALFFYSVSRIDLIKLLSFIILAATVLVVQPGGLIFIMLIRNHIDIRTSLFSAFT